jgi:TorA maturation chaperone TorD
MSGGALPVRAPVPVAPEDLARADMYALISNLFYAPPTEELLRLVAQSDTGPREGTSPFASAWRDFKAAAAAADPARVREEFETLFYGVGRPKVMVFGSYYLAGFMMEKPLAALRDDLAALGFARKLTAGEPEDHIAALCDVMRMLILSGAILETQKGFFSAHMKPWYPRLADSLARIAEADFFKRVGRLAAAFFDVEAASFDIAD